MQVVVVGSGAREHALAWRLAQSPNLTELHAAPGNPGIAREAQVHDVKPNDPWILGAVAVLLGITAFLASAGPALRAAEVDPLIALRYE